MPEHLRALVVILVLTTIFFAFARQSACTIMQECDFTRRRNLWFALTLAAFLSQNFWLYSLVAIVLLIYANRRESNPPALFFFILFVVPVASIPIPGMGLINYIFDLTYPRILALFILLPAFFGLIRQSDIPRFGRFWPDKALAGYFLLELILTLLATTMTDTLRQVFYMFIDIFLPYFVISRSLRNIQAFRDALLSLVLALMVVALIAIFESLRFWLLYQALLDVLGMEQGAIGFLPRDGMLRATSSAGGAIVLGYLMVIGIGLYLFIQRSIKGNFTRRLGMLLLIAGSIAALSRGPWVGAAVLIVVFIATGRYAARHLIRLALASLITFSIVALLPGGERVINLLPIIGSTDTENIDYREDLITNSMIVIQRNPWFGSVDFTNAPEMEAMRQGQGIIDIVNTYLAVALRAGFVGLGVFVAVFALTLMAIFHAMRSISDKDGEYYLLGRVLLATQVAILLIIFTVSNILLIPLMYWSVAGLGVAYAQMIRKNAA